MDKTFYLYSLGCPKNEVDSECMSALLKEKGYRFTDHPKEASFLVVNTCAFLESAVTEAIDAILELAEIKKDNPKAFLIVTGCLPQRYKDEITKEIPEVDAVLGTGEYGQIAEVFESLLEGHSLKEHVPGPAGAIDYLDRERLPSAPPGTYAYLKIAEGCSNACAYCIIPRLRGPQRSRSVESIVKEAQCLVASGVKELILIAQDTTRYGEDLPERPTLAHLLRTLSLEVPDVALIRTLYFYADRLTEELLLEMAGNDKIAHYIDLPIQHASDRILEAMRRHETSGMIRDKITRARRLMPDLILRSTVITGFPGETEEDFDILLEFIKEIEFDRLGVFEFSPEDGTPAFLMPDQVPHSLASKRRSILMANQQDIARRRNEIRIHTTVPVILEAVDERGILFEGRSYGEAPEIDPVIYVAATTPDLTIGSRPVVRIVDAGPYDLTGVSIDEHRE